jgi:hypothetical protein
MKKIYAAIIILIILNVIVGAWYINNHIQPARNESLNSWVDVAEWDGPTGDTNMTTQPFTITSQTWQIISSWYYTNETGEIAHFEIQIFDANTDKETQRIVTDDQTPYGSTVMDGAGTFYFKIFVLGTVSNWKISVEEYKQN